MTQDPQLPLLVATLTAGCAGLAFTAALVAGDQAALSQLFTTIIGLLASRVQSG